MNDFDKHDASGAPAWLEPLTRKPLRVHAQMTDEELVSEVLERLSAYLNFFGLPATTAGFRSLMFLLLLAPGRFPLKLMTDTDLMKGGRGGAAARTDLLRRHAARLMSTGRARNNVEAATILSKRKGEKLALGTIKKLLSNPNTKAALQRAPLHWRYIRRMESLARVKVALVIAVDRLEKNYELKSSIRNPRSATISNSRPIPATEE